MAQDLLKDDSQVCRIVFYGKALAEPLSALYEPLLMVCSGSTVCNLKKEKYNECERHSFVQVRSLFRSTFRGNFSEKRHSDKMEQITEKLKS